MLKIKCASINRKDQVTHMLEKGAMVEIVHGGKNERTTGLVTDIGDEGVRLCAKDNPAYAIRYDSITEVRTMVSSADMAAVSEVISRAERTYGAGDPFLNLLK